MHKLMAAAAIVALIWAGPGLAQDAANSNSNSGANSASSSGANNGGIFAPIDASSRTNSTSNSAANAVTSSLSTSQGGNSGARSTATGGTSSAVTGASTSNASNAASNAGNAQSITFNSTNPDSVRTVPQVYAPGLTSTLTETCMGSTSGGAAWLGGGFSLGSSWRDEECVRRLTARELSQTLGDREAARAIMCGNKAVLEAYDRLGRPCPQSPNYKADLAVSYMPVIPAPPAPLPPPAPVVVNVPAPSPAQIMMQPVPNPPPAAPHHYRPKPKAAPDACSAKAPACPK